MVEGEEASQVAALGGEGGLRLAGDLDNQRAGPSLSGSFSRQQWRLERYGMDYLAV
jgi:hypothetical protein